MMAKVSNEWLAEMQSETAKAVEAGIGDWQFKSPIVRCADAHSIFTELLSLRNAQSEAVAWRDLVQEAIDLLAERKHGNPARSPGHNARLMLQDALDDWAAFLLKRTETLRLDEHSQRRLLAEARAALRESLTALEAAEDRDERARFRANSPRQDQEVRHLRRSAIRTAARTLTHGGENGR